LRKDESWDFFIFRAAAGKAKWPKGRRSQQRRIWFFDKGRGRGGLENGEESDRLFRVFCLANGPPVNFPPSPSFFSPPFSSYFTVA